jgi:hypothetical protein
MTEQTGIPIEIASSYAFAEKAFCRTSAGAHAGFKVAVLAGSRAGKADAPYFDDSFRPRSRLDLEIAAPPA